MVEFLIDVLKLASLNTPDTLANSFSMLGALILGDFAVQAGWLGPEVLVYMAFVSVAGFAQPSYELGYAFKLLRVALLLATAAFRVWGFALGCARHPGAAGHHKASGGPAATSIPLIPFTRKGPAAAAGAGAPSAGRTPEAQRQTAPAGKGKRPARSWRTTEKR